MDIMNYLPEGRFEEIDDLLAFISIYDDENRTKAYYNLLEENAGLIKDAVCADLGAGLGIMSLKMLELGAKKVYLVEKNPHMFDLAKKTLAGYDNVVFVNKDIKDFMPPEKIDVAVHEFYGQLLFDEELILLENLNWKPARLLPDGGKLLGGIMNVTDFDDEIITPEVLKKLDGVLVSGLFDEEGVEPFFEIASFNYGQHLQSYSFNCKLPDTEGDLLYMALAITHQGKEICRAGICDNWSYVWTYKSGKEFNITFEQQERGTEVFFSWIK